MKKILIVDDEEDMIWTLQKNLKDNTLPVDVVTARSGEEALERLEGAPVDLIISDIKMPGMSGLDLLVTVKKHYPQTEVVIMTAYPSPEFRREVLKRGGLRFVEKPFDINDLRETVREVLNGKPGFKGSVAGIELSDVIQLNCLSRATAALRVMATHQEGMIFFKEGNIVHAVCDTAEGEEAFYEILGFEQGTKESIAGAESPAVTITQGFESLLMEGFRRIDEAKRSSKGDVSERDVSDMSTTIKEEDMDGFKGLLDEFTKVEGVGAACLVGRDGFLLESSVKSDIDGEMIGAIAASGFGSSESMGNQLGKGSLSMTMVEFEHGPVMFAPVGEEAFLVVIAGKECNVGMVRVKIKKHSAELANAAAVTF